MHIPHFILDSDFDLVTWSIAKTAINDVDNVCQTMDLADAVYIQRNLFRVGMHIGLYVLR